MTLQQLLDLIRQQPDQVGFDQVMTVIDEYYDYHPCEFYNGSGADRLVNSAGQNQGSCKIFAFARLHDLNAAQTLACFGDYYRRDVLAHPGGGDHANIRRFMRHGWSGIEFAEFPLQPRD